MKNLYDFITSLCKNRDMKLEDLQKKLDTSRTTLYRYMKGINRITPDLEQSFKEALNMDKYESITFSKFVSLSAYDQTLIDSRYVIDEFMFGNQPLKTGADDIDMVFYNNDKYLRTLKEVLDIIASYCGDGSGAAVIKIMNCLDENIFIYLSAFLDRMLSAGPGIEVEHFVGLLETDYMQNTSSFINIFPLMKYDRYRLYFREKETEDSLIGDSLLISMTYKENGSPVTKFFSISFYEESMSECIAFSDAYMYSFLSRRYEHLKLIYKNVIHKHDRFDFGDDLMMELAKKDSNYTIKDNPCYEKIPYDVYVNLSRRASVDDMLDFMSEAHGRELGTDDLASALGTAMDYIKKRIDYSKSNRQIDVFTKSGMLEFVDTGRISDHLAHMPAFSRKELHMIISGLRDRSKDPRSRYTLHITDSELTHNDLVIFAVKNYGVVIEYFYPEHRDGIMKTLLIESRRLASIFCDYIENFIPINRAMPKDEADRFLQDLLDKTSQPQQT